MPLAMSPPAWGWPDKWIARFADQEDVPTRVGMARQTPGSARAGGRCPHPRGDGPSISANAIARSAMSPPAWGWPDVCRPARGAPDDVPTRMGMAREIEDNIQRITGCPHPRGDGPRRAQELFPDLKMSPPAWGWPENKRLRTEVEKDVPTRVGMARSINNRLKLPPGCPHPRGDGPESVDKGGKLQKMSPPAWGWPA